MQNERCLRSQCDTPGYIEKNPIAARIFAYLRKQFPVIHGDYLDAFPSDPDWPTWLVDNVGLSIVSRLVTPPLDPESQLTKTFEGSVNKDENSMKVSTTDSVSITSRLSEPVRQLETALYQNNDTQDHRTESVPIQQQPQQRHIGDDPVQNQIQHNARVLYENRLQQAVEEYGSMDKVPADMLEKMKVYAFGQAQGMMPLKAHLQYLEQRRRQQRQQGHRSDLSQQLMSMPEAQIQPQKSSFLQDIP